jgi:hypothetical protein
VFSLPSKAKATFVFLSKVGTSFVFHPPGSFSERLCDSRNQKTLT